MKFRHSSFYPELQWKVLERLFLPGVLAVTGLGWFVVSLRELRWSAVALSFAVAILLLALASLLSPAGWTSISVDRTTIRVVPYRHFFRLLLPLKKTYHLDRPTRVYFNLSDIRMHISQKDSSSEVIIYSLAGPERRNLAALLKKLALGNGNLELEIDKTFVDRKCLKFAPAEKATYSYMLRKKDRLELSIRSEIEFSINLKEKSVRNGGPRTLSPKQKLGVWHDEVILRWTIKKSGMHDLEFVNPLSDKAARMEYSLTRCQRFNRARREKTSPVPKNAGPAAAPAQINK